MPAIVAVRWVGLFAQHVRQARISAAYATADASGSGDFSGNRSDLYEPARDASGAPSTPVPILSMVSDVGVNVNPAAPDTGSGGRKRTRTNSLDGQSMRSLALPQSFSSSTKSNAFFEWLDGVAVWLRLDSLRMQVALIALLSLPHFMFYFVRLSWHPDYYNPSHVGCMYDDMVCRVWHLSLLASDSLVHSSTHMGTPSCTFLSRKTGCSSSDLRLSSSSLCQSSSAYATRLIHWAYD